MDFIRHIDLQKYADNANLQFREYQTQLSEIEIKANLSLHGNTVGKMVGAILNTVLWLVATSVLYFTTCGYIDNTFHSICFGILFALLITLLIDEIIHFVYYRRIIAYKNTIAQLKKRIIVGQTLITSNQDVLKNSSSNGWNHILAAESSIPEEAALIENTVNSMGTLKKGFINGLKNFLLFVSAFAITVAGSITLIETAFEIVIKISETMVASTDDPVRALPELCIFIAVFVELFLLRLVWNKMERSVTNNSVWVVFIGPILYLALVALLTFLYALLIWALVIVFVSGVIAIIGAIIAAAASGG